PEIEAVFAQLLAGLVSEEDGEPVRERVSVDAEFHPCSVASADGGDVPAGVAVRFGRATAPVDPFQLGDHGPVGVLGGGALGEEELVADPAAADEKGGERSQTDALRPEAEPAAGTGRVRFRQA